MANFTAGTSFSDGVTNDVTAAKLNALVADAVPTSNLSLNSTTGTIANFTASTANITLGTIPTLTVGTTTSTAGVFTSGTITTGTTTGTAGMFTSGTITTLNSTTPTFLGAITASTNTINVGSGQIYKDASGLVGIGTTSPDALLDVKRVNTDGLIAEFGSGDLAGDVVLEIKSSDSRASINIGATGGTGDASRNLAFSTSGTERLRIDSDGNVGIGQTSLTSTLTVNKAGTDTNIQMQEGGVDTAQITSYQSDMYLTVAGNNDIIFRPNSTERMRIDSSGGVTIAGLAGTGSRAVNASAAGLLSAASDASLKEEVVGASIAGLNEILQIHPKMYRWKDDIANRGDEASVELGFIANDVAPIIPSAAPMGNDGLYGFYDRSITAALVKAVQELSAKVTALEAA